MIAGLESITDGELYIGERKVNDVSPKDRDISMVFQDYALYPHMTVYKNMAFGLENRKVPKGEIEKRVVEVAKILDIESLLERKPKAMSGGQRQRVALGRAMVREPAVFLLDEPLSNLDAKLRTSMRTEIIKLHKRIQTTFVYVTHDQTEAMTMGDRIVVLKGGVIQQVGTPQELYDHPCNQFVAGFIGTPQMNFIKAYVKKDEKGFYLLPTYLEQNSDEAFDVRIPLDISNLDLNRFENKVVILGVRPEHIVFSETGKMHGMIEVVELLGSESYVYLNYMNYQIVVKVNGNTQIKSDTKVHFNFLPSNIHLFEQENGKAIF